MTQGIAHEELIAPELTLPVQFRDMWHGPRAASPEKILAVSVLGQAANDLQSFRFARPRRRQRLFVEAYNWVASSDRSWPYAFLNLCDALCLSADSVRAQLLDEAPSVAPAQFRGAAPATSRTTSERRTATVFRLSRPANVKSMNVARSARPRGAARRSASSRFVGTLSSFELRCSEHLR
jgi:hypothetical protein